MRKLIIVGALLALTGAGCTKQAAVNTVVEDNINAAVNEASKTIYTDAASGLTVDFQGTFEVDGDLVWFGPMVSALEGPADAYTREFTLKTTTARSTENIIQSLETNEAATVTVTAGTPRYASYLLFGLCETPVVEVIGEKHNFVFTGLHCGGNEKLMKLKELMAHVKLEAGS